MTGLGVNIGENDLSLIKLMTFSSPIVNANYHGLFLQPVQCLLNEPTKCLRVLFEKFVHYLYMYEQLRIGLM